jgi:hypothetical protein
MDLQWYCKFVLPERPLTEEQFSNQFEFGYSYSNYLISFSEHDALHYLYEESFSDANELRISRLEDIYKVGFVGRNYFYHCTQTDDEPVLDETITVEKIRSIAQQLREFY